MTYTLTLDDFNTLEGYYTSWELAEIADQLGQDELRGSAEHLQKVNDGLKRIANEIRRQIDELNERHTLSSTTIPGTN